MPAVSKACLAFVVMFLCALAARAAEAQGAGSAALCGGERYELGGGRGGEPPALTLTVDGVRGEFLIDYGATQSSLSASAFGGAYGPTRKATLPLGGLPEQTFDLRSYGPQSTRAGILGADVLSRLTVEFSEGAAFVGAQSCEAQTLGAAGFTAIAETGFFSADPAKIDPSRADVPVVHLRLGDVRTWAQIDTGYADTRYPHSVDINQPLYDRLVASGVALERVGDVGVRTCKDAIEKRSVYAAKGMAILIENERGAPILRTENFSLIVKGANDCGGIGGMSEPAAQLGASFLDLFGTTIFDPKAGTVWVRGDAPVH